MSAEKVFECRMCGHCCEGKGGIVLSPKDLERLSAYLGLEAPTVIGKYAEVSNGKLKIRCGGDGWCIFYKAGQGCSVHKGRPDICRAWPFFRGNLEDPSSLEMAREFCPGISRSAAFGDFVVAGMAYLRENDLFARDSRKEANALIVSDMQSGKNV